MEVRFVGERKGVHPDGVAAEYLIANSNLTWNSPIHGLQLGCRVLNLGDAAYSDPSGEEHLMSTIRQDGWTWLLSVRYGGPH
jgi:hypothetical protein